MACILNGSRGFTCDDGMNHTCLRLPSWS